ncbi:MAG: cadmium-translocating P-type ATPase [Acholeplasmatales bacterium]|nr:cadmium-translocating P-type ATPase [Acholeplasmatales bacterium]
MTRKQKKLLIRIIIALVLFIIVFTVDKIVDLNTLINSKYSWFLPFFLYFFIYLLIGYDVLKKAILGIIHGQLLDENFLMAVATIGAFSLGIYCGISGKELEGFDEGCAVLLFYQVGEWFQSYAVSKSRKSISSLMDIRPDKANLVKEYNIIEVSPEEVSEGDIILVKPGEKIPLDGIVTKGCTSLDTKALTGESLPRDVKVGDEVISGTLNLSSDIYVEVTTSFYESTVSKILELVENASSNKSKAENFITKFARIYTPTVVIMALLLCLIPSFITGEWSTWIYRSLCFLVVSCPCALVISIPLSFFAGIGASSRHGLLVKGSNYLEAFNKSKIFVFDKTGTLTKGNFKITKIYPENKKDEILRLAAIAENNSNHPIALSIKNEYKNEIDTNYALTNLAGMGIVAKGENDIYCGNDKLMDEYHIKYEKSNDFGTIIYVAKDLEYLGYILIQDEIKEEVKDVISALNKMGNKTIMLTGDNESIAKNIASEIGISEYRANLLPNNKVNEVEKLLNNKDKNELLCFVGDGINDAPVLMRSDIGIAMGGVGSDAAIEASDIVIMDDNLNGLLIGKKIARKTMRIVFENIIFALLVKFTILILSAFGITNMWLAVFGDVGVAIIAILNAIRVNSKYN